MTEDNYIMWLNSLVEISTFAKVKIFEHFKTAENVWNANKEAFFEIEDLPENIINKVIESKNMTLIEKTLEFLQNKNTQYITVNNPLYPEQLKYIADYPLGFFMFGKMPEKHLKTVAIVGTRKSTDYGKIQTKKFAKELAENNVVIISGMADGIDSCAHNSAISSNGKTIAVLGCGIDITYPKHNRNLEIEIIKNGCVITEYALGTRPYPSNFPVRNRIISGLSDVLLVMEAPIKSGAIITANSAIEQGKTVFALPGDITRSTCAGTNKLIKDGAIPLLNTDDILYELGIEAKKDKPAKISVANASLNNSELKILKYINDIPISVDEIALKTNMNLSDLNTALTMLELEEYVTKISANRYIKNHTS